MLRTVIEQNYFQFNKNIYKQQEGVAMGSPMSAIRSKIFLQHMRRKINSTKHEQIQCKTLVQVC